MSWDKARKRRRSGKRTFTPRARWPRLGWAVTEDHLADVDALIAHARASLLNRLAERSGMSWQKSQRTNCGPGLLPKAVRRTSSTRVRPPCQRPSTWSLPQASAAPTASRVSSR